MCEIWDQVWFIANTCFILRPTQPGWAEEQWRGRRVSGVPPGPLPTDAWCCGGGQPGPCLSSTTWQRQSAKFSLQVGYSALYAANICVSHCCKQWGAYEIGSNIKADICCSEFFLAFCTWTLNSLSLSESTTSGGWGVRWERRVAGWLQRWWRIWTSSRHLWKGGCSVATTRGRTTWRLSAAGRFYQRAPKWVLCFKARQRRNILTALELISSWRGKWTEADGWVLINTTLVCI